MKLSTLPFACAWAVSALVLWLVCAVLAWSAPGQMFAMGNMMMHTDMAANHWQLTALGVLLGGIAWAFLAFVWGGLVAFFYNRFAK